MVRFTEITDQTIVTLAKTVASSNFFGRTLSPLINTEMKGGDFPVMLHQFRRAIEVQIVRGNAMLKMSRLHYVRRKSEEAKETLELA